MARMSADGRGGERVAGAVREKVEIEYGCDMYARRMGFISQGGIEKIVNWQPG
jgi:hypothetical protein